MKHPHYKGLTDEQVEAARRLHGENVITPARQRPVLLLYLEKFADPIIRILLLALAASLAIALWEYAGTDAGGRSGDAGVFLEPLGILAAVLLATGIGFVFEWKANRAFRLLSLADDDEKVRVIREDRVQEVAKRSVVVGDIVVLSAGDEIPADGEIIEATSLLVDESSLTGEPEVRKSAKQTDAPFDTAYAPWQAMRGSHVLDGQALMRTLAVGDATEAGRVFAAVQIDSSVRTPLNEQLDGLARVITWLSYAMAVLVVLARTIQYLGTGSHGLDIDFWAYFMQTVMLAVTLVVCAVPEGLPMSVTLSLALSMRRLFRANNLVRRMHACETMGACDVICTDKTGTLTENRMSVSRAVFFGSGAEGSSSPAGTSPLVSEAIAVNSTAALDCSDYEHPKAVGNPTEGALLLWLQPRLRDESIDGIRRAVDVEDQLSFSGERKYMATVVQSAAMPGRRVLYVKGAPEIVLRACSSVEGGLERAEAERLLAVEQEKGLRTLGLAYKLLADDERPFADGRLAASGLCFQGFFSISDPLRADASEAVAWCRKAGIDVKLVTGDNVATAREVALSAGLIGAPSAEAEITGEEMARLTDEELLPRLDALKIIGRARPLDKKRLVELLQRKGHVVAVTGDGTNDAPALKAAQVGLSMGSGTNVAKTASDITILDDSLSSVTQSVVWGRSLYKNIQRFILFQLTINVVACLTVMLCALFTTASPLGVAQMLWINLIMDTFAAAALASLPPEAAVAGQKPRKRFAPIVTREMWKRILGVGLAFTAAAVGVLLFFTSVHIEGNVFSWTAASSIFGELSDYEESLFFTFFVMLQLWNIFNARAFASGASALRGLGSCKGLLIVIGAIFAGQVLIVNFGGGLFHTQPISLVDWVAIVLATSLVLWVGEAWRYRRARREGKSRFMQA